MQVAQHFRGRPNLLSARISFDLAAAQSFLAAVVSKCSNSSHCVLVSNTKASEVSCLKSSCRAPNSGCPLHSSLDPTRHSNTPKLCARATPDDFADRSLAHHKIKTTLRSFERFLRSRVYHVASWDIEGRRELHSARTRAAGAKVEVR